MSGFVLRVPLSKRERAALMQTDPRDEHGVTLDWPNGCRKSIPRRTAEFKIVSALLAIERDNTSAAVASPAADGAPGLGGPRPGAITSRSEA